MHPRSRLLLLPHCWCLLALVVLCVGTLRAVLAADSDPIAWWKLDEGTGRAVKDASTNHYDGLVQGTVRWTAGVSGRALAFDGSSSVQVPFQGNLALGNALTIQAWVRPADYQPNTFKEIVTLWDSYLLRLDNPPEGGKLSFFTFLDGNPEPRIQSSVPALRQWHLVFAVWDGQRMQLWLDGLKREASRTGKPAPKAGPLVIGQQFVGDIDEVRIYRRALTEDEILDQYPPQLKTRLVVPQAVLGANQPFEVTCEIQNVGGQPLLDGSVELKLPAGVDMLAGQTITQMPAVSRKAPVAVRWRLSAGRSLAALAQCSVRFNGMGEKIETAKLVVSKPIPQPAEVFDQPTLSMSVQDLCLGNSRLRFVFPKNDFGYGVYAVDVRQTNTWKRMAVASTFSALAVRSGQTTVRQLISASDYEPLIVPPGQAGVAFKSGVRDASGTSWDCRFSFLLLGDDRAKLECQATPDSSGSLALFAGPMLYVGEGAFGSAKDEGLFCGLEWPVRNESSSANLDMHDPDYYLRFVPHPNKITIPLMAIGHQGAALGLYWDCLQKWDTSNAFPAAVFASPNFLEGQSNHLMGLFLPSVPDWVEPNHLEASANPYPFQKGVPLKIQAWITGVSPARQPLACLSRYFDTLGVPEPATLPRGAYTNEVAFSMRAFFESLWDAGKQKWWTSKGGPEALSQEALPPHYVFQLRVAAAVTPDPALRAKYSDRASLAEQLGAFRASWDDLGFTWADSRSGLISAGEAALNTLSSMEDDGSWRFRTRIETEGVFKGMDYSLLGPDKAAELGTCARNAYLALRFARLAGDAEVFQAADKSLKFMEQFTVPRAAQVWECPVHAPDILAAADAIDAYLEAYRYSGQRHYLDEAIRWAWAGLPFVYVWNPPGKPILRCASIAILGGSWFNGSWIGQPVQWNGLRYAYALLKLAEADASFPWRKIGEGITVSALYQQDTQGTNVALWPDNFSALDWSKCAWVFEPGPIMKNVFKLIGHDVEPATTVLGAGTQRLCISSRARLWDCSWQTGALRLKAQFPAGESGVVVVAGLQRPGQVSFNGRVLSQPVSDLLAVSQDAWTYDAERAWLTLKLTSTGPHDLQIDGTEAKGVTIFPPLKTSLDFEFDNDLEGWMPANQVTELRAENGWMRGTATGGDPYLHRLKVRVPGSLCPRITVRARASSGVGIAVFWITEDSPHWGEDKVIHLPLTPGATFRDYVFELGRHNLWGGKIITGLRLDPLEGGAGGTFDIDSIHGSTVRLTATGFSGPAFGLQILGLPSRLHRVEASPDLRNWGLLAELRPQAASFALTDPKAGDHPWQFYRVVLPP